MNIKKINDAFGKIFQVFKIIQGTSLLAMSILVFLQVVLREAFNLGVQWVFELSCFFQVTMVWLGVPILLYNDEHIRITALYNLFPQFVKRILNIFFYCIYIASTAMMSFGYVKYVQTLGMMKSPILGFPNYLFFGSFAFGLFMSVLVLAFKSRQFLGRAPESLPACVGQKENA